MPVADRRRTVSVGGNRLALSVLASDYTQRPGAIQLTIGRLVCQLQAPADLSRDSSVSIDDQWDSGGIGWHEITAVGDGVSLQNSPFPASSVSGELLHYPNNLLSSPLDVHSGSISVHPGNAASTYRAIRALPGAALPVRALNALANRFNALVGAKHLTVGVGLLAVLLSMLLGAGHAFLPGHGKTIMAAYLVGRRGRLRDVVTVGATVTLTHTAGVLILGALISLTAAFAPTAAEQALAVVSGLLVAGVGVGLLIGALRRRRGSSQLTTEVEDSLVALDVPELVLVGAERPDTHPTAGASTHGHEHPHGDGHAHGHGHGHGHGAAVRPWRPDRPGSRRRPGTQSLGATRPARGDRAGPDRLWRDPRLGLRPGHGRRPDRRRSHPGPATRPARQTVRRPVRGLRQAGQRAAGRHRLPGAGRRRRAHPARDRRQHLTAPRRT